jgi:hypothetical protein
MMMSRWLRIGLSPILSSELIIRFPFELLLQRDWWQGQMIGAGK